MPFVLDASVALAWPFRDERNAYAHRILRRLEDDPAVVPTVWILEMANGLLVAERRGRFTAADVAHVYGTLADLPIESSDLTLDQALGPVLDLARAHELSAYDATYLELAMREGLALATQDDALRVAANRVSVPLVE
jgi:predicted nucleic acid-binding protein